MNKMDMTEFVETARTIAELFDEYRNSPTFEQIHAFMEKRAAMKRLMEGEK
mgnify:FL=1